MEEKRERSNKEDKNLHEARNNMAVQPKEHQKLDALLDIADDELEAALEFAAEKAVDEQVRREAQAEEVMEFLNSLDEVDPATLEERRLEDALKKWMPTEPTTDMKLKFLEAELEAALESLKEYDPEEQNEQRMDSALESIDAIQPGDEEWTASQERQLDKAIEKMDEQGDGLEYRLIRLEKDLDQVIENIDRKINKVKATELKAHLGQKKKVKR